jgi:tetratricopeptide (TPR) repeat protein
LIPRKKPIVFLISVFLFSAACSNQDAPANLTQAVSNIEATPAASNAVSPPANKTDAELTSMDYMREGTVYYVRHDFVQAIPNYQRALEMEKKERKLSKDLWIVLVDNLAMAHGMTGDIPGSLSVLEYGISKEPTYPMFYYNMACGYGENGDEDNAIKYLRLAARYKANMLSGEEFPDPSTDNSFLKIAGSEKFKKALAEIKAR